MITQKIEGRIPTRAELLEDYKNHPEEFDKDAWYLCKLDPHAGHWIILRLRDGFWSGNTCDSYYYIRCVREDESKRSKQEWSKEKMMTWYEAPWYAKSLGVGWRVPTIEELNKAHENKVEGFESNYYWSSSECNSNSAWLLDFTNSFQYNANENLNHPVRCVRDVE